MQLLSCFALRIRHVDPQIAHTFSTVVLFALTLFFRASCFLLLLLLFFLVFDCFLFWATFVTLLALRCCRWRTD